MAPPKKPRGRPRKNPLPIELPQPEYSIDNVIAVAVDLAKQLVGIAALEDNEAYGEAYRKILGGIARGTSLIYDGLLTVETSPVRADYLAARSREYVRADEERALLIERIGKSVQTLTGFGISEPAALQIVFQVFGLDTPPGGIGTSPLDGLAPKAFDAIMEILGQKKNGAGAPGVVFQGGVLPNRD
jgi:hypothetical protein